MEESFFNLVKNFNSELIKDYREKIRTNIYKELDELRKKDDGFSEILERAEDRFWYDLLKNNDSNLGNLFNLYVCLKDLKINIDRFKYLVNTD